MPEPQLRSTDRIASAIKRLSASAEVLESASDEFAKPIEQLNQLLRRLNLGLATWKRVTGGEDDYDNYWKREVGFAKIDGLWSLALRAVSGNHQYPDREDTDVWAFVEAPPSFRIEALPFVPDVIEELIKNTEKTAAKLKETSTEARELAQAATTAALEFKQEKKKGAK